MKQSIMAIIVVGIVVASLSTLYFYRLSEEVIEEDNILSATFYRGDEVIAIGEMVGREYTTIDLGGEKLTGITDIKFRATVTNTGNITLTSQVIEAQPEGLWESFDKESKTIESGETVVWETPKLDTIQFETYCGDDPPPGCGDATFYIKIEEPFVCPIGSICKQTDGTSVGPGETGVIYLEGFLTYNMQPDETGVGSTIEFTSATGSDGESGVGDDGCLSTGTNCVADGDCCSDVCEGTTATTRTLLEDTSGQSSCGQFCCPDTGYEYCERVAISSSGTTYIKRAEPGLCSGILSGTWATCIFQGIKTETIYSCS